MTDDFAVAGDVGGYVPCGGMSAMVGLTDDTAAIFGVDEGYVPPLEGAASEPASFDDTAAVDGSAVGFVAAPCVTPSGSCTLAPGSGTKSWSANGDWLWEPGDIWTFSAGGTDQLLDSAETRNFYFIGLENGPYRHVTEAQVSNLLIMGYERVGIDDVPVAIPFDIYKSLELYDDGVHPASNVPEGVIVYSGVTSATSSPTIAFNVSLSDVDDSTLRLVLTSGAGAGQLVKVSYGPTPVLTYDYYDEISNYGPAVVATTPLTYTHLADTVGGFTDETGTLTWSWSSGTGTRGDPGPMLPDTFAVTLNGGGFPYVNDTGLLIAFANGPQSFMAWIKPAGVSGNQSIMSKQTGSFYFRLKADKLQLVRSQQAEIGSSTTSITAGVWTHVALVYDGSNGPFRFYINGVADADINTDPNLGNTASDLLVGVESGGGERLIGSISDVALWDRALSGAEVATIYAARDCL